MRDGVKLYAQVYSLKPAGPYPIILLRTPYGTGSLNPGRVATSLAHLVADGYIFVQQDIRGRFKSDGAFVMLRQPRDPKDAKAPGSIDESTDTYDTIAWLLANVPSNNGRVGIAGTSYGAWLAVMGMLDPHPALKAVVPQASPADMWIGDDFHHNGAFRLSYEIAFAGNDHVFRTGHRIMVQVQSTWFPVIDRNPQRFVPNIFQAQESDFQRATQRVFRSGQRASYIAVPIEVTSR